MASYDTPIRAARAAESRQRILDAAAELFVRDGYATTALTAIADEAGLAVETIYKHFGSKANLLQHLLQRTLTGDTRGKDVIGGLSEEQIAALNAEPDPSTRLRRICELAADIYERAAEIQRVFSEAAGADPVLRELWRTNRARRVDDIRALFTSFAREGSLSVPLAHAVDIAWALGGPEIFAMLTRDRGWPTQGYERWLHRTLHTELLDPRPAA
jgi:AcrR family transcriptional regulator